MNTTSIPASFGHFLAQFQKGGLAAASASPDANANANSSSSKSAGVRIVPNADKVTMANAFRQQMQPFSSSRKRPLDLEKVPEETEEEIVEDEENKEEETREEEVQALLEDTIPTSVQQLVFAAQDLHFQPEVMAPATMYVQVPLSAQRYSLQEQTDDLLDELLSRLPARERHQSAALNQVHTVVQRFRQLRHQFSILDHNGTVQTIARPAAKPLSRALQSMDTPLPLWMVPTALCERKLFCSHLSDDLLELEQAAANETEDCDYALLRELTPPPLLAQQRTIGGEINKYKDYQEQLQEQFQPFLTEPAVSPKFLHAVDLPRFPAEAILANLDGFRSTACYHGNRLQTVALADMRFLPGTGESLPIRSVLCLPWPVVRYAAIQLPGTPLLQRAQLNSLGGFFRSQLLRQQESRLSDVLLEDLHIDIQFDADRYLVHPQNFGLANPRSLTATEFRRFTQAVVPDANTLVQLMKPQLVSQQVLSWRAAVQMLEPFLLYPEHVTESVRRQIVQAVDGNVRMFRKAVDRVRNSFHALRQLTSPKLLVDNAYTVLNNLITPSGYDKVVCEKYDLASCRDVSAIRRFTNLEYLVRMVQQDRMRLYTDAINLLNFHLTYAKEFQGLLQDKEEHDAHESLQQAAASASECGPIIIAKQYNNETELKADNGRVIFFDQRYDRTDYSQLDLYEDAIAQLELPELLELLSTDLREQHPGMTEEEASYLATTLLDGHKEVRDGHYAILHKGYRRQAKEQDEFYVRRQGQWVLDSENANQVSAVITDDSDILCFLREKCAALGNETCVSSKEEQLGLRTSLLRELLNEFDQKFNLTSQESEELAKAEFVYDSINAERLAALRTHQLLKYNQLHHLLGFQQEQQWASTEEELVRSAVSPYAQLLNTILAQEDQELCSRQLLKFAERFCVEHGVWYQCKKTRTPLVPVFRVELAKVFILHQPAKYQAQLHAVQKERGAVADGYWVDKRTGWRICPVDEASWEELDDDGHKVLHHSVLSVAAPLDPTDPDDLVRSFSAEDQPGRDQAKLQLIRNVIQSLSSAIGVHLAHQMEFMINIVLQRVAQTLHSEAHYNQAIEARQQQVQQDGGKSKSTAKPMPYDQYVNLTFMYAILAAFVYGVQTSVPSVKTRRRFEGCAQLFSLSGYPLGAPNDLSCVRYVTCVALAISTKHPPGNALQGKHRNVDHAVQQVRDNLEKMALLDAVLTKMQYKTLHLMEHPEDPIPVDQTVYQFVHFLPPLQRFQVLPAMAARPGKDFFLALPDQLRTGNPAQHKSVAVLQTKLLATTLAMVQAVDEIVGEEHLLLRTGDMQRPLAENACCQTAAEGRTNALGFFEAKNKQIRVLNQTVKFLTKELWQVYDVYRADLEHCGLNSKLVYPGLPAGFSAHTRVVAFVHYCKFLVRMPVPPFLRPFCPAAPEKEELGPGTTRDTMVAKLLETRPKDFTEEGLQKLLQAVSAQQAVALPGRSSISPTRRLRNLLESPHFLKADPALPTLLLAALAKSTTDTRKDLMNHVVARVRAIKERVREAISRSEKKTSRALQQVSQLDQWETTSASRVLPFLRNAVRNLAAVYPAILQTGAVKQFVEPGKKRFTADHVKKLNDVLLRARKPLLPFLQDRTLTRLLTKLQQSCRDWVLLAEQLPCVEGDDLLDSARVKTLLEFCLWNVLDQYWLLAQDKDMVVTSSVTFRVMSATSSSRNEDEDDPLDTQMMVEQVEREVTHVLAADHQALQLTTYRVMAACLEMVAKEKSTLDMSYEAIRDINFRLRQKETDRFVDAVRSMNDEERRTYRQLKSLGLTSLGFSAKDTTRYNHRRYQEEADLRARQEEAEWEFLHQSPEDILRDEETRPESAAAMVVVVEEENEEPSRLNDLADEEWNLPFEAEEE